MERERERERPPHGARDIASSIARVWQEDGPSGRRDGGPTGSKSQSLSASAFQDSRLLNESGSVTLYVSNSPWAPR